VELPISNGVFVLVGNMVQKIRISHFQSCAVFSFRGLAIFSSAELARSMMRHTFVKSVITLVLLLAATNANKAYLDHLTGKAFKVWQQGKFTEAAYLYESAMLHGSKEKESSIPDFYGTVFYNYGDDHK